MDIATVKPILYWGGVVFFLLLELRFSYRQSSVSKLQRWLTNVPLAIVNGTVYHLLFWTTLAGLMVHNQGQGVGLLNTLAWPDWFKLVVGVLILDLVIYLWHFMAHMIPLVWRFHRVHHSDMNMDVSTANRFHLGEFLVSGLVRLAAIQTFGISLPAYMLFEVLTNFSIQFHHSSIQVNPTFEKYWMLLFVPPYLHRIHHSVKIRERDANYGVIFSIWDRIFGTLVTNVDHQGIVIGIGSHRRFAGLGFWNMLAMPFTKKSR